MTKVRGKKDKIQFIEFIVLSIAIHFLIIYLFVGDTLFIKSIPLLTEKPVDVYVVGPEGVERQVVSVENEPGDKEANPNARFLSNVNKRVNAETRARLWGKPFNKKIKTVQGILKKDLDDVIGSYIKKKKTIKASDGDKGKNYSQSRESSTYDYLPGVQDGEITSLNTAEFIYYSFYKRVEDSIVFLWNQNINDYINTHPDVRANLGKRDYITEIEAVMDKDGNFLRMSVIKSSGVAGIDSAPGKAFSDASPFENPPKGMIGEDKLVRMKWRFIVSIVEQIKSNIQPMDYYNSHQQGYPDPALQRQIY
ncbi:MAG: hypothetical protein WCQ47_00025 [bacterium]